jgi:hypothetical protein
MPNNLIPRIEYADKTRKFHAQGTDRLTHYELACGHIMLFERDGQRLELWREPATSVYAVRWHDHKNHVRIFWETFDTYTAAARLYYRTRRNLALRTV